MPLELYLAFVLATTVLIVFPGPNVMLIVANSMAFGARRALLTVAGTQAAQAVQLAAVVVGMASLLHLLATWFEVLRWAGVAYLVWLGVQRWRQAGAPARPAATGRSLFWQGFAVAATNPKVLFFYAAFFPQFVDPAAPAAPQLALLAVTFMAIAAALDSGYALLAGRTRAWFADARRARIGDRLTGALLVGTGVWLALARRG